MGQRQQLPASRFFESLDYFAAPLYGDQPLQLSRARALVGTNLFVASLLSLGIIFVATLDSLGEFGDRFVSYALLPALLLNLSIPFILRHLRWLWPAQQVTLLATFIAIGLGIYSNGGPMFSSSSQLFILHAALAFFLLGIRGGLAWSTIDFAAQLSLYGLWISGFDFPNYQTMETATAGAIFNWTIAFTTIVALIVLIELNRGQLELARHQEQERFRYLATHDSLTQIANRSHFEDALRKAIDEATENNTQVLLFYIDLDKFKPINDNWGHDTGDKVLRVVAARLQGVVRSDSDMVARLGGDEFAILLKNIPRERNPEHMVDTIYQRIVQPIHLYGDHFKIDCSIGVCTYPADSNSAEQLWKQADAAMYTAKQSGEPWHIHHGVLH